MDEPPAKRAKRLDSAAMWDHNESTPPKSPQVHDNRREEKARTTYRDTETDGRIGAYSNARGKEEQRKRSRSRDRNDRKRARSSSRDRYRDRDEGRDRDRYRDRDRNRDRERKRRDDGASREVNGHSSRRERSRSRDRHQPGTDHNPSRNDKSRRYSRSRSPVRNGSASNTPMRTRSPPPSRAPTGPASSSTSVRNTINAPNRSNHDRNVKPKPDKIEDTKDAMALDSIDVEGGDDAAIENMMSRMMGFSSFKTTQNTKVPGNQIYAVRKEKKTEYRQYMNRVGGFNRPLSPSR